MDSFCLCGRADTRTDKHCTILAASPGSSSLNKIQNYLKLFSKNLNLAQSLDTSNNKNKIKSK